MMKIALFCQNCSLPFSLRSLDIPALLKSWKKHYQLHVMVDASNKAFAAIAYFRFQSPDDRVICKFVLGKTRGAPIKQLTIPKLDLQSTLLGTRMVKAIQTEHYYEISETHIWSDSTTVVQWIRNSSARHPQFIANRIAEILDLTKPSQWHHIPGKVNTADDGSHGLAANMLTESCRWLNGPAFLLLPREMWPELSIEHSVWAGEIDTSSQASEVCDAGTTALIEVERYSSWNRLWHVIAWLKRFVRNCRGTKSDRKLGTLSVNEKVEAENHLIRMLQEALFAKEIKALQNGMDIPCLSPLRKLVPFLDSDGILHSRGRIGKSTIQCSAKYPIISSPKYYFTKLILLQRHNEAHHVGLDHFRNCLRDRFWIIKARSAIRKVVHGCMYCRKQNASPKAPIMSDLPDVRIQGNVPLFHATRVDYLGPFFVCRFRKTEKRYGCLFVCIAAKAVHLEIAHSLDANFFGMAMRHFHFSSW
jgi:hypothetical protein